MSPSSERRLIICAVVGMHMVQQNCLRECLQVIQQQKEADRERRCALRRLSSPKSVEKVYNSIGAEKFHQVYRMTYETFEKLASVLEDAIKRVLRGQDEKGDPSLDPCYYRRMGHKVCLAVAIGFFGGSPIQDLMYAFKIRRKVADECIVLIVNAMDQHCPQLQFFYLRDQEKQREIANGFQEESGFAGCAGCIESVFLSFKMPADFGFDDAARFYCSRKKRHGMHCHMVCDVLGKFLHISFGAGANSDAQTFRGSYMSVRDLFAPGLRLVGGAFLSPVPEEYLATPMKDEDNGIDKDEYNRIHQAVHSKIHKALGMWMHRWPILRQGLPTESTGTYIVHLVECLASLQNFCIGEGESMATNVTHEVKNHLCLLGTMDIGISSENLILKDMMGGGHHWEDGPY